MDRTQGQFPPELIDENVLEFCHRLSPGQSPSWVPVRPDSATNLLQCFPNVEKRISERGGEIVYGWEISEIVQIHLEARFHAVWRSPEGNLIDVTPEEFSQPRILFLIDPLREYTGTMVPNERFALGPVKMVRKYWQATDRLEKKLSALAAKGVEPGSTEGRSRLASLVNHATRIRQQLQRSA